MTAETSAQPRRPRPTRLVVWMIVGLCVVLAGTLFVLTRQWGWTPGWLYVGLVAANGMLTFACVLRWNPC